MSIEQKQQKNVRFEGIKRKARKAIFPAAIGAGILFPATVYTSSAIDENPNSRSHEISDFLNNRPTETSLGVAMAAGVCLTIGAAINSKYLDDETKDKALRLSGPILFTAAAGSALLDAQTTVNYAVPAGLALSSTYAYAANNINDILQRTHYKDRIAGAVVSSAGLLTLGAVTFLAAADKL